jgi:hypothetical protein
MSESTRKRNPHLAALNGVKPMMQALAHGCSEWAKERLESAPDLTFKRPTDEERLNKTEQAYLRWLRCKLPRDAYLGIQNITLKLAWDCRLTMDFSYIDENGRMTFVDTKGVRGGKMHAEDDAVVKIKVAAHQHRWARFVLAHKEGTGWKEIEIKP